MEQEYSIDRYSRRNFLMHQKLLEFLPVMLLTNLSTFLLITVDDIVVANLVGEQALSAVNFLSPFTQAVAIASGLLTRGIASVLSESMGKMDTDEVSQTKKAAFYLMIIMAVITSILQVPLAHIIINFYHVSPEVYNLTWAYAYGVMIATPTGLINTVCTYEMIAIGKMKSVMFLSAFEGIVNLIFDVIFVGGFGMKTEGAGFGTAIACSLRCVATVMYVCKKTDLFTFDRKQPCRQKMKEILKSGMPEASETSAITILEVLMTKLVHWTLGEYGVALWSVLRGAKVILLLAVNSITGALRPILGIVEGGKDRKGTYDLMLQSFMANLIFVGGGCLIFAAFPNIIFRLYGSIGMDDVGVMSLRVYLPLLLLLGFNRILRVYFSIKEDSSFVSVVTFLTGTLLPVGFAFILSSFTSGGWFWLCYSLASLIELLLYLPRYYRIKKLDLSEDGEVMYLSLHPQDASNASEAVRQRLLQYGASERVAIKTALCVEEMSAYLLNSKNREQAEIQLLIRTEGKNVRLVMLNNGQPVDLQKQYESNSVTTDNYELIMRLVDEIHYKYVLKMNYTQILVRSDENEV